MPFVGSYTDTVVKTDAGWLFEKRIIAADLGGFRQNPNPPSVIAQDATSGADVSA
ncbi:MAG TPA: hypothetical protein VJB57_07275 [Dehalococcoidia bacterium]|nr:hypothetical protein [Dehalococcoidia bacterium]